MTADIDRDTFERYPDPNRLLRMILEEVGAIEISPDVVHRCRNHDQNLEIVVESFSWNRDPDHRGERISLRRRETLLDRAARILGDHLQGGPPRADTPREVAREILIALGADPERPAP